MIKPAHKQTQEWRYHRKNKLSGCKIPSTRYTIIMNQGNSDQNFKIPKIDTYVDNDDYSEKLPDPDYIDYDRTNENYHVQPRRGELVINGGFENPKDPFAGWIFKGGVEEIDPHIGEVAHQGFNAARLGFPNPKALLYQDVAGICPGSFYQLSFHLSAAEERGNARVIVEMDFLDAYKNSLPRPALQILVPEDSLSSMAFVSFNNSTAFPAPPEAHFARISFQINTHNCSDRYIHLDDVSLISIGN